MTAQTGRALPALGAVFCLTIVLAATAVATDYYLWTDEAGTVHITDNIARAPRGHTVVELPDRPEYERVPATREKLDEIGKIENIIDITVDDEDAGEKPGKKRKAPECRALDVREFGIIGTGLPGAWTETTLVEKYGPPCEVIHMGEDFFSSRRIIEGADGTPIALRSGRIVERKQYVYWGDYSNRTTIVTIVGNRVVAKERIYE